MPLGGFETPQAQVGGFESSLVDCPMPNMYECPDGNNDTFSQQEFGVKNTFIDLCFPPSQETSMRRARTDPVNESTGAKGTSKGSWKPNDLDVSNLPASGLQSQMAAAFQTEVCAGLQSQSQNLSLLPVGRGAPQSANAFGTPQDSKKDEQPMSSTSAYFQQQEQSLSAAAWQQEQTSAALWSDQTPTNENYSEQTSGFHFSDQTPTNENCTAAYNAGLVEDSPMTQYFGGSYSAGETHQDTSANNMAMYGQFQMGPDGSCYPHPQLNMYGGMPMMVMYQPVPMEFGTAESSQFPQNTQGEQSYPKSKKKGKGKGKDLDPKITISGAGGDHGACGEHEAFGDPLRLAGNATLCTSIIHQLQGGQADECSAILKWLCPAARELALSTYGCRVIQKALEVAGGDDRAAFVGQFVGHAIFMLESPNANHVLQKYIEVMPPAAVQVVMDELASYPGGWQALACHKFGCRVQQRLMEHCSEEMTDPMTQAIAIRADFLCRHPFGNYVIQNVLSNCSPTCRDQVAASLIQGGGVGLLWLAQNRMASNVLEQALELCGPESQQALATAILSAPPALLEIGCSRFGFYVVRRMLEVLQGPLRDELLYQLAQGTSQLRASNFGRGLLGLAKV